MKLKIRQSKGVSMISLVITVIILIILTNVVVYYTTDNIQIKKLTNLYNDIEILRNKTSEYYNEYGKLPIKIKYTNVSNLSSVLSKENDTGDFYVIDLEAMNGITLNYGKDYEKVKTNEENADNYSNIYIINENSHNVFYVEGVSVKEDNTTKIYYTDYIKPDETTVDLRYIDGVLIPEGYYCIGRALDSDNKESIVISTNKDEAINDTSKNQYIWNKQISKINKIPNTVKLSEEQNEYEFYKSVELYKGYFKNKNIATDADVIYLSINKGKWSNTYTKKTEYIDENGDKVSIPKGFKVNLAKDMNTIKNGLVAQDEKGNEWVWIEVPEEAFIKTNNNEDYETIKEDLIEYTKEYKQSNNNYDDEWYDGCGIINKDEYDELYKKMLTSIYDNHGFWISRYEIGDNTATENNYKVRTSSSGTTGVAVSKPDQIPYNYITCEQAQNLASNIINIEEKTSSLLFGIQWDLVCKYIENNSTNPGTTTDSIKESILVNSKDWGNYKDIPFYITSKNARKLISSETTWNKIERNAEKTNTAVLTTGASIRNQILNIYDFAGNLSEFTLEHKKEENDTYVCRGGYFEGESDVCTVSDRGYWDTKNAVLQLGFRIAMY